MVGVRVVTSRSPTKQYHSVRTKGKNPTDPGIVAHALGPCGSSLSIYTCNNVECKQRCLSNIKSRKHSIVHKYTGIMCWYIM